MRYSDAHRRLVATTDAIARVTSTLRVRDEDAARLANHGDDYADRLEASIAAIEKAAAKLIKTVA